MSADPAQSARPSSIAVRPATMGDVPAIHSLILELARFENLEHEVTATEAATGDALFGPIPRAEAVVAEVDGEIQGFALFYPFYSTFAGRCGLYLEDLYVRQSHRRRGLGRALVNAFITEARRRQSPKIEWRVLTWNHEAIKFYKALGASILHDWVPVRLPIITPTPSPISTPDLHQNPGEGG